MQTTVNALFGDTDYGAAVRVDLGPRSYDVRIGPGVLDRLGEWTRAVVPGTLAALIGDAAALERFGPRAAASLERAGYRTVVLSIPPGEESKSLTQVGRLFDELFKHPFDRKSPFVALGGGVTGDLVGFLAATFKRGVPFIQVPTTLLSQVDASVGGKTGINHPAGKNLIGAVHQPSLVVSDIETLRTLPAEQFACGLAEIVKHALIRDPALFDWLELHAEDLWTRGPDWPALMTRLVAWNTGIKARVVEQDETETALRGILNYGHTIGHALEAVLGYGGILHGQAVSIGTMAVTRLAVARGLVGSDLLARQAKLFERLKLPTRVPTVDPDAILAAIKHDKKSRDGKVRFVLPLALGRVDFFDDVTEAEIRAVLRP